MIYTLSEYKDAAIKAERLEFAKRYAVADPKTAEFLLGLHNRLVEGFNDEEFVLSMYKQYLELNGLNYGS
jgi:hypothetical protein